MSFSFGHLIRCGSVIQFTVVRYHTCRKSRTSFHLLECVHTRGGRTTYDTSNELGDLLKLRNRISKVQQRYQLNEPLFLKNPIVFQKPQRRPLIPDNICYNKQGCLRWWQSIKGLCNLLLPRQLGLPKNLSSRLEFLDALLQQASAKDNRIGAHDFL